MSCFFSVFAPIHYRAHPVFCKRGAGFGVVADAAVRRKEAAAPTVAQILLNIVPANPVEALGKGDALLDMGRTGVNVTGDIAGTAIAAKSEKELDESLWR